MRREILVRNCRANTDETITGILQINISVIGDKHSEMIDLNDSCKRLDFFFDNDYIKTNYMDEYFLKDIASLIISNHSEEK